MRKILGISVATGRDERILIIEDICHEVKTGETKMKTQKTHKTEAEIDFFLTVIENDLPAEFAADRADLTDADLTEAELFLIELEN